MEPSQTKAANLEFTESLSPIEFDAENGSFQATYDSTRESTGLAVVAVVATARGEDPQALTPLQTVIDTDALDKLATESATGLGLCDSISFRYDGFEITVTSEEVIEANPIENTSTQAIPVFSDTLSRATVDEQKKAIHRRE